MKLILLLAIIISCVWGKAVELTAEDFTNGKVTNTNGETKAAWFVKFYNPRCPHCKKFAEAWDKLADDFGKKENINFGSLDCAKYKPVCDRFNIWGVPTLMMFKDNQVSEYLNSNDYNRVSEYLNQRAYDNSQLTERWKIPKA